jgi:hypothetical protein
MSFLSGTDAARERGAHPNIIAKEAIEEEAKEGCRGSLDRHARPRTGQPDAAARRAEDSSDGHVQAR